MRIMLAHIMMSVEEIKYGKYGLCTNPHLKIKPNLEEILPSAKRREPLKGDPALAPNPSRSI